MPRRIVDGDGAWTSKKLHRVEPEQLRAEYTYLLPLALENGVFELDIDQIWLKVYAYQRPSFSLQDLQKTFTQFELVGLLFRYHAEGKEWGFWVGIDKPGRLPPPSQRAKWQCGPNPDEKELAKYINSCEISNRLGIAYPEPTLSLGIANVGTGLGSGSGSTGSGSGLVQERSQKTLALAPRRKTSTTPASPEIFTGVHLKVTGKIDEALAAAFPKTDRAAEYMKADRWMEKTGARRRNVKLFLFNWFEKVDEPPRTGGFDLEAHNDAVIARAIGRRTS